MESGHSEDVVFCKTSVHFTVMVLFLLTDHSLKSLRSRAESLLPKMMNADMDGEVFILLLCGCCGLLDSYAS